MTDHDLIQRLDRLERLVDRPRGFAGFFAWLRDWWFLVPLIWFLFFGSTTILLSGAWARYGDAIKDAARQELGLSHLERVVLDLAGVNRIIRQPEGQSYVREPVRIGESVVFVMTIGRTPVGEACRYIAAIPLYTDEDGITASGEFQGRGRQYTTQTERAEIVLSLPLRMTPGRVSMQMQIEYQCPEREVQGRKYPAGTFYELTYPVVFRLLPRQTTR